MDIEVAFGVADPKLEAKLEVSMTALDIGVMIALVAVSTGAELD